jgi:DNA-binding transcriptional MocR family regulator
MQNTFALRLLRALFVEARRSRPPGKGRLALLLRASIDDVEAALVQLERRGLVDARRARLTFAGLAVASGTGRRRSAAHPNRALAA